MVLFENTPSGQKIIPPPSAPVLMVVIAPLILFLLVQCHFMVTGVEK